MKKKGCLIPVLSGLIVFVALVAIAIRSAIQSANVQVVFDARQYAVQADRKNISEAELIEKLGEPDRIENWDYKTPSMIYPIRTLYYGNSEYNFNSDNLQRITLYDQFSYSHKSDFLSMFNLAKYSNTQIKDTGFYYRAYNCGIHDLWLEYGDGKITMAKISYGSLFDGS